MTDIATRIIGSMERGLVLEISSLSNLLIAQPERVNFGLVVVFVKDKTKTKDYTKLLEHLLVDTIDDNNFVIKLPDFNHIFINKGVQPCVASDAEVKKAPHGKWFHIPLLDHRVLYHQKMDAIYEIVENNCQLYTILDIYPMSLAKFMSKKERDEYFKQ